MNEAMLLFTLTPLRYTLPEYIRQNIPVQQSLLLAQFGAYPNLATS